MKRRVARIGPTTLMISLPSKWVKKFGIKKGDELEVKEADNALQISTSKGLPKSSRISVNVENYNERVIRWLLSGLHKSGYDEIEVLYSQPNAIGIIQELVKDLYTGFIIADQTPKKCLLKSVSSELEKEFDTILRRAFFTIISIGESTLDLISKGNLSQLKELIALEHSNNQFTNFCQRIINKGLYDYKKAPFMYVTAWQLEKICDEYKYICEFLSTKNIKGGNINNDVIEIYREVNSYFNKFYTLFYDFKLDEFNNLVNSKAVLIQKIRKSFTRNEIESRILYHLSEIVNKTTDLCASTIAIHLAYEAK